MADTPTTSPHIYSRLARVSLANQLTQDVARMARERRLAVVNAVNALATPGMSGNAPVSMTIADNVLPKLDLLQDAILNEQRAASLLVAANLEVLTADPNMPETPEQPAATATTATPETPEQPAATPTPAARENTDQAAEISQPPAAVQE